MIEVFGLIDLTLKELKAESIRVDGLNGWIEQIRQLGRVLEILR